MRRIPDELMERMAERVSKEDGDAMGIPGYLHQNALVRWMAWQRVEEVARLIRRKLPARAGGDGAKVMDFGCGTGVLFEEAGSRAGEVIGVDVALEPARLLVEAWQLDRVRLMQPEAARTALPARSLDAIIAAGVLELIDPLGSTIQFFRNRLKPGGSLVVSLPTENFVYRMAQRLAGFEDNRHENNAAVIHREILGNGFRETAITRIPARGPLAIHWIVAYEPF